MDPTQITPTGKAMKQGINSAEFWLEWCCNHEDLLPAKIKHAWHSTESPGVCKTAFLQLRGMDRRLRFCHPHDGTSIDLEFEVADARWERLENGFEPERQHKGIGSYDLMLDHAGIYNEAWNASPTNLMEEFIAWRELLQDFLHPDVAVYFRLSRNPGLSSLDREFYEVNVIKYPPPILTGLDCGGLRSFPVLEVERPELKQGEQAILLKVPNARTEELEGIDECGWKFYRAIKLPDFKGALPNTHGTSSLLACATVPFRRS